MIEDVIRCHEIIKPGADSTSSAIRRALEDLAGMNISRAILQDIKNLGKDEEAEEARVRKYRNSQESL